MPSVRLPEHRDEILTPVAPAAPYRLLVRTGTDTPSLKSWGEAWSLASRNFSWSDGDQDTVTDDDITYYTYTRAALVFAAHLGVTEAKGPLAWIDGQLSRRNAKIPFKWRVD